MAWQRGQSNIPPSLRLGNRSGYLRDNLVTPASEASLLNVGATNGYDFYLNNCVGVDGSVALPAFR